MEFGNIDVSTPHDPFHRTNMASLPGDPAYPTFFFRKSVQPRVCLSFFVKKLRRLSTPAEFFRKFVETCVLPLILYCSPAIFPGLLKHGFALLMRLIKLISQVSGLSFSYLTNLLCERHIKASSDFAEWILEDHQHPLHDELSKARSHTTRSCFKLLPSKTAPHLSSLRYHDSWSTETRSSTILEPICLESIYIISPSLTVLLP